MKHIIILILLSMISCNGQIEKNEKMKNQTNEKKSPFNVFNDGGMEINFENFIIKNKDKIKSEVNKLGYKVPDKNIFIEKIKYYYNWDLKDYSNIVVLQNDMFPVIAIKDYSLIYIEEDGSEEINGQLINNYNKFIIYDDMASLVWLKLKHPYLLDDLVIEFGFTKNDDILKFVFNRIDFKSESQVTDMIFENHINKLILRKNMLSKIRELKYHNEVSSDYGYVVGSEFYSKFPNLIENIKKRSKDFENSDYTIGYLLNEMTISGILGAVDSHLNSNPQYLKTLKQNNYFNFQKLHEYAEHVYEQTPDSNNDSIVYKIKDADGYTNLRKEKNSFSEILQKIYTGSQIEVLDNSGDWWLIQTKEGKKGYVYKSKIILE